ncbi:MAG: hypothetical protein ABSH36_00975 [Solirubrobacteraceae bacterium]
MFEPGQLDEIRAAIERQTAADRALLQVLRDDVLTHLSPSRFIRPHSATAVSLVASDGGNNRLVFDPFSMQLVRVVDSYGGQLFIDVISPTTDPDALLARHHEARDPLHVLMEDLEVEKLSRLSPMIPESEEVRKKPDRVSPSWTLVYRDLAEWAVLYHRVTRSDWGSDTLIVRDGLLRSKIFSGTLFIQMRKLMLEAIERNRSRGIRLFVVGVAKHSQVLARYRLAMALEDALPADGARFVPVPRELERKVYKWEEFARGVEDETTGESAKFVIGSMFLVRFGSESHDPVWAIDVFEPQATEAGKVFGYLLQDAIDGFPVPYYPRCLQRAHEHAQVVDLDLDVLQDTILHSARSLIEEHKRGIFDGLALAPDIARRS